MLSLAVFSMIKYKKIEIREGILCLIISFPILENLLMKQHAVQYTYDRMKVAWIVIFIVCELIRNILDMTDKNRAKIIVLTIVCFTSCLNLYSYMNSTKYIWEINYRKNNKLLADYVTDRYSNALYASNSVIRGYMNLLFGRGIWENQNLESAISLAAESGKQEIVYLQPDGYDLQSITVYVMDDSEVRSMVYSVDEGTVVENKKDSTDNTISEGSIQ